MTRIILLALFLPISAFALDDIYNIPLNDSMTRYNQEIQQQNQMREQQRFHDEQQRQMQEMQRNQQRMELDIQRERARNAHDGGCKICY